MLNVITKQQTIIDTSRYRVKDIVRIEMTRLNTINEWQVIGYGVIENVNTEYIAITPDFITKNIEEFKKFYDSGNDLLYFYINREYIFDIKIKDIHSFEFK